MTTEQTPTAPARVDPDPNALLRVHLAGIASGIATGLVQSGVAPRVAIAFAQHTTKAMWADPIARNHAAEFSLALWHDDESLAPDSRMIPVDVHIGCEHDHDEAGDH